MSQPPSNKPAEPMAIVMCTDDHFVMPLTVAIVSIAIHLEPSERAVIYLIDGGITDAKRLRMDRCLKPYLPKIQLIWLQPDMKALAGLQGNADFSTVVYLRLFLPNLVPPEIKKVIYLDCDLILRTSIGPLWKTDLAGAPLMAALDQNIPTVSSKWGLAEIYQVLGLPADSPYFNSGVLVFDVEKWRSEPIAASVLEFLRAHFDVVRWPDQDGLNAVLSARVKLLDPRWNYQYGAIAADPSQSRKFAMAQRAKRVDESFLVHYTSRYKPWIPTIFDPERIEFLKYLRKSGWYSLPAFRLFMLKYRAVHIRHLYVGPGKRRLIKLFGSKSES